MSEERRQILNMLAEKKISVEETERLLAAIESPGETENDVDSTIAEKKEPRWLKIKVQPKDGRGKDKVNIRVPLKLIKAGMKLGAILPDEAKEKVNHALKEKGINFKLDDLKSGGFEDMITALTELSIDVDDQDEKVQIFCE